MKYTLVNERIREALLGVIRDLPIDVSHPYVVEVRQRASKRTILQNRLYFRWIEIIRVHVGDSTGKFFSKKAMHEFFAEMFQPAEEVEVCGIVKFIRKSTADNSVEEMQKYMEMVDRFCADRLHLILPVRGDE